MVPGGGGRSHVRWCVVDPIHRPRSHLRSKAMSVLPSLEVVRTGGLEQVPVLAVNLGLIQGVVGWAVVYDGRLGCATFTTTHPMVPR